MTELAYNFPACIGDLAGLWQHLDACIVPVGMLCVAAGILWPPAYFVGGLLLISQVLRKLSITVTLRSTPSLGNEFMNDPAPPVIPSTTDRTVLVYTPQLPSKSIRGVRGLKKFYKRNKAVLIRQQEDAMVLRIQHDTFVRQASAQARIKARYEGMQEQIRELQAAADKIRAEALDCKAEGSSVSGGSCQSIL
ncbi:hypothetical protein K474DRAFT_1711969 [Panus rudis PR-1116 ss-1]|nr:hypothetical protein K474DRAFT_1711969 [Panus rudis PR-1116 ss-1]